jgi:hypothetical protein
MEFTVEMARAGMNRVHIEQIRICEKYIKDACDIHEAKCAISSWLFRDEEAGVDDMLDSVFNEIQESGYGIFWNRPCQWYEIKW